MLSQFDDKVTKRTAFRRHVRLFANSLIHATRKEKKKLLALRATTF